MRSHVPACSDFVLFVYCLTHVELLSAGSEMLLPSPQFVWIATYICQFFLINYVYSRNVPRTLLVLKINIIGELIYFLHGSGLSVPFPVWVLVTFESFVIMRSICNSSRKLNSFINIPKQHSMFILSFDTSPPN